ncbi:electron transfer flavoprotein subunit beta/FixA family protein [Gryllotalpicola sp.]|uniref:electron transfer flavoprotein subunit beta/FixA family protein n=1 Tax=Gryllotalpicola sp. TaxID=1932787 RepID=UPI00262FBEEB|nr:electron transfer flavoprotein subunit beta/FixA family protein [Gryllotalpicola sp.]
MKIAVLVKEVPDTYGDRKLDLETGLADRDASEKVLDEVGERAIEVALKYLDTTPDTEITLVSMTPASATSTLRKGLAMGAHSAVHIVDDALVGADLTLTAEVLAAALKRTGFDLVITGNQSTDGVGGVIPAMLGELLGVPVITSLNSVEITADSVSGNRTLEGGKMTASAPLPAVISITEQLPDARFPNFKGITAAKKKPLDVLSLADLEVDPMDANAARSIMVSVTAAPPRSAGVKIVDEGDAGSQLAEFLITNRLA